jgi:hypothetical protein
MNTSELNPKNYKRIFFLNTVLSIPLFIIFAWPYVLFSHLLSIHAVLYYPGAILFSLPFMLTILHGYVTLALGSIHRSIYYEWLQQHPLTYGLLFHPIYTRTRFRLAVLAIGIIMFIVGTII